MASDVSELAASGPFISEVLRCRLYVSVGIAACTAMINPSRDALNQLAQATHATALCLNSIRHRLVYDIIAADDPEQMPRLTPDSPLITDALELARASTLGKSPTMGSLGNLHVRYPQQLQHMAATDGPACPTSLHSCRVSARQRPQQNCAGRVQKRYESR